MPRSKLPELTGQFGEPIRVSLAPAKGETAEHFRQRWMTDFNVQAAAKVPALVRHLWPDAAPFDPENAREAAIVYRRLVVDLAQRLGIRDFLEAPDVKRHPVLVRSLLVNVERVKAADRAAGRKPRSDLAFVLEALRYCEPGYETLTKAERRRRARRWCDLVSSERARQKRRAEKKLN